MQQSLAAGLLATTFLLGSAPVGAAHPSRAMSSLETSTLTVKVVGFRNAKGKVGGLLFRSADGFPDEEKKAFAAEDGPIDPKTLTAQIEFQHVPFGPAAVTVLHDENMNDKLDTNLIGVPREGYGTSNNPKKRLHTPTFAEGKFLVNKPRQTIQIELIYW